MDFIVYSLPRCRSFWLSKFLTYGDFLCSHDEAIHFRSLEDVQSWMSLPQTGSVETSVAPFWRLAPSNVKTVVIRRPIDEIIESLGRGRMELYNRDVFAKGMEKLDRKLRQIERRVPNVLSLTFADLSSEDACRAVFEHCLPYRYDPAWYGMMAPLNLQVNLLHETRYYQAHEPQLKKLADTAAHRILTEMASKQAKIEKDDGLTIQEESFEKWFTDGCREGKDLFAGHSVLVGESPSSYEGKNLGLMRDLDKVGCLQVITARCNGRLFGYLVSVISPSLESPDLKIAVHTTFYSSPEYRGVGMRLQRASVEALRTKGIDEVYLHAGTRGTGARNSIIYRRLGAQQHGQLYKLSLN